MNDGDDGGRSAARRAPAAPESIDFAILAFWHELIMLMDLRWLYIISA